MDARVGDTIEVRSVQVGQPVRRGTVKEITGTEPLQLRIQWEDGHETVLYPSGGMVRIVERADS